MVHTFDSVIRLFGTPRPFSDATTSDCFDLMREFLRREALWANAFGIADTLPLADLPELVSPGMSLSAEYLSLIGSFSRSSIERICCVYILKWYQVPKEVIQVRGPFLPAPYLPLVKLFELGGSFTREHRVYIDVHGSRGIHAGVLQNGSLVTPFAVVNEE